jgi:hypothetical protein
VSPLLGEAPLRLTTEVLSPDSEDGPDSARENARISMILATTESLVHPEREAAEQHKRRVHGAHPR